MTSQISQFMVKLLGESLVRQGLVFSVVQARKDSKCHDDLQSR